MQWAVPFTNFIWYNFCDSWVWLLESEIFSNTLCPRAFTRILALYINSSNSAWSASETVDLVGILELSIEYLPASVAILWNSCSRYLIWALLRLSSLLIKAITSFQLSFFAICSFNRFIIFSASPTYMRGFSLSSSYPNKK